MHPHRSACRTGNLPGRAAMRPACQPTHPPPAVMEPIRHPGAVPRSVPAGVSAADGRVVYALVDVTVVPVVYVLVLVFDDVCCVALC